MRRIGVLTSGGDAPGMNAAIRAVVRNAVYRNLEVCGIQRGYQGLINGDMMPLGNRSVGNIVHLGGTILETTRCPDFKIKEIRAKAIEATRKAGIEAMVVIGGDGTLRGATVLAQESGLPVVGVTSTIDNDVYGTDYTIGFDTAINTAVEYIDKIRDTARSHDRLFFVEVMGRTRGFIALQSGIAAGAEAIMIPEVPENIDALCADLERTFKGGKRSAIIIVAEAGEPGSTFRIARAVKEKGGLDSRVCVLGHVQRGGSPTARDRILASRLGAAAVDALVEGRWNVSVGEVKGDIAYTPLEDTWSRRKELDGDLIRLMKILAR
ncbi:MAG: 6-phosphofructokinase [Chloroflexi bacterium]|nr:6-phosphofructokinase [Chloroflexota bacterium]